MYVCMCVLIVQCASSVIPRYVSKNVRLIICAFSLMIKMVQGNTKFNLIKTNEEENAWVIRRKIKL